MSTDPANLIVVERLALHLDEGEHTGGYDVRMIVGRFLLFIVVGFLVLIELLAYLPGVATPLK